MPAGRPKKPVDWDIISKLCGLHCNQEEIAAFTGVSLDTIERACKRENKINFAEYYRQKKDLGRVSLRRKQWEVAMSGDKTLLIWLGKQMLGQSEKTEHLAENVSRPNRDKSDEELE